MVNIWVSRFLVGAFLVKRARLLQWLVFSRRFSREKCPTLTVACFLVGAFSFKEKSPTITVASFFFRQTTELIAYVPLFTETDKFTQAKFDQCKLTAKGPPFRFLPFLRNLQNRKTPKGPPPIFFRHCANFFFENFLRYQKSPPFEFFDIFRHYATFSKFFQKLEKIFNFFCFQSGKVIFQSYRA